MKTWSDYRHASSRRLNWVAGSTPASRKGRALRYPRRRRKLFLLTDYNPGLNLIKQVVGDRGLCTNDQ
jgi:hypothetical protein